MCMRHKKRTKSFIAMNHILVIVVSFKSARTHSHAPATVSKSNLNRRSNISSTNKCTEFVCQLWDCHLGIAVCCKVLQIIYHFLHMFVWNARVKINKNIICWLHLECTAFRDRNENMNEIDRFKLNEWHSIGNTTTLSLSHSTQTLSSWSTT